MDPRGPWLTLRLFPQTSQFGLRIIELICSWPPTPRCRIICAPAPGPAPARSQINKAIFLNATVISYNLVSEDFYVQKRGSVCTEGGGAPATAAFNLKFFLIGEEHLSNPRLPRGVLVPVKLVFSSKKGDICRVVQSGALMVPLCPEVRGRGTSRSRRPLKPLRHPFN